MKFSSDLHAQCRNTPYNAAPENVRDTPKPHSHLASWHSLRGHENFQDEYQVPDKKCDGAALGIAAWSRARKQLRT